MLNKLVIPIVTGESIDGMPNDQLVVIGAHLSVLSDKILERGHEVPVFIAQSLKDVDALLDRRMRDQKEARFAQLQLQRQSLLSRTDKLTEVEAQLAALEAELNPMASTGAATGQTGVTANGGKKSPALGKGRR